MGVPTSEVGYTPAMPRTEDHEVRERTCGGNEWGGKKKIYMESINTLCGSNADIFMLSMSVRVVTTALGKGYC